MPSQNRQALNLAWKEQVGEDSRWAEIRARASGKAGGPVTEERPTECELLTHGKETL